MKRTIDLVIIPENIHWGGSELLWSKSSIALAKKGLAVLIMVYDKLIIPADVLQQFDNHKIEIIKFRHAKISKWQLYLNGYLPYRLRFKGRDKRIEMLQHFNPKLTIINQGFNFNGAILMNELLQKEISYVSISHGVSEMYWPDRELRESMLRAFVGAKRNFFVSNDNLEITQMQLGRNLDNASIIRNPFQVPYFNNLSYPISQNFHLACVGRYDFKTKGQDALLRVIMQEKWKNRSLIIHFFGNGNDEENLRDIIEQNKIKNVQLHPHTDVLEIWRTMHGLILPSRSEGLPISLVEAMLCHRVAIVTNVGGSLEVMLPNETGFVAAAPRPPYLDEALEFAWQNRMKWEEMGNKAGEYIRTIVPEFPELDFANILIELIN